MWVSQMKQSPTSSFRPALSSEEEMFLRLRSPDLVDQMRTRLREVGLRPTRTRVALSSLLFDKGDRHVSAEMLFEEANQAKVSV
jgi:hypothetical protein